MRDARPTRACIYIYVFTHTCSRVLTRHEFCVVGLIRASTVISSVIIRYSASRPSVYGSFWWVSSPTYISLDGPFGFALLATAQDIIKSLHESLRTGQPKARLCSHVYKCGPLVDGGNPGFRGSGLGFRV